MAVAGNVILNFSANVAQITSDIGKIQKRVDSFGKEAAKIMGTVKAAAAGIFAGLVTGAAALQIKKTADSLDLLAKTADRVGVSAEALQKLNFAAGFAGVSSENLRKVISKLSEQTLVAARGSQEATKLFTEFGLSVKELSKMNAEQRLYALADATQKIEDPARRTALLIKLLGEEGQLVGTLLSTGADAIKKTGEELDKLSGVLSRADLSAIETANDQFTKLQTIAGQVAQKITASMSPAFSAISQTIIENSSEFAAFVNTVVSGSALTEEKMKTISRVANLILLTFESLRATGSLTFRTITDSIDIFTRVVAATGFAIVDSFNYAWIGVKAGLTDFVNFAIDKLKSVVQIGESLPLIGDKFVEAARRIEGFKIQLVDPGELESAKQNLESTFEAMGDTLKTRWAEVGRDFVERSYEMVDAYKNLAAEIFTPTQQKPAFVVSFERNLSNFKKMAEEAAAVANAAINAPSDLTGGMSNEELAKNSAKQIKSIYEITANDIQSSFASAFQNAATSGQDFAKSLKNSLASLFINKASQMLASGIVGGLFGGASGGGLFGGFFADGGRPPENRVSVVGERGPEFFVPDSAGTVMTQKQMAGMVGGGGDSITIVQNMNFAEGVNAAARQEIYSAMPEIKRQAVEAMIDYDSRRGRQR